MKVTSRVSGVDIVSVENDGMRRAVQGFAVDCPWPYKGLSPNDRPNKFGLARVKKKYRDRCWKAALAAGVRRISTDSLRVSITFHPPVDRTRDIDNLIASFKAGADGIADACRVDDALWVPTYQIGEIVKHGRVSVVMHPSVEGVIS